MAANVRVVKLNPARVRIWINRLPFSTRIVLVVLTIACVAGYIIPWFSDWAALKPSEVGIWTAYRLNTYPFTPTGILHLILSLSALIPLLERFESEHGTLITFAMLTNAFSVFPGVAYILLRYRILRRDVAVQGPSVWVYILLACEAVKMYRANPAFKLGAYSLPTYLFPLPLLVITHFVLPTHLTTDSIILNLCACSTGYAFELGYLKIFIPPERALRFIEGKLNLLGRLPHYVSIDQKTFGRYGVLPTTTSGGSLSLNANGLNRGLSPARFAASSPAPPSSSGMR